MSMQKIFNDEIQLRFDEISNKLYNFKYSFDLFINYLEDETDIPLNAQCFALILKEYFNKTKEDYNKLEEDLGILL